MENYEKKILTSGCAGDAAIALAEASAVHHHPALVRLLPSLTDHIGGSASVVIATLGCRNNQRIRDLVS